MIDKGDTTVSSRQYLSVFGANLSKPHINVKFVRSVGLSVFLSVRTFMTRKYTRTVLIYGYLQLLIAAFKAVWCTGLYTNVQQTCSDKQLEQTGSYTKKQVYRSLMNNNFIYRYLMLLKHGALVSWRGICSI